MNDIKNLTDILRRADADCIAPVQIGDTVLTFKKRANIELAMLGLKTVIKGRLQELEQPIPESDNDLIEEYMFADSEVGTSVREVFLLSLIKSDDKEVIAKLALNNGVDKGSLTYVIVKELLPQVMALTNL